MYPHELEKPLSTADLQALVDYCEQASQGNTPETFPATPVERARWEIRRRLKWTEKD